MIALPLATSSSVARLLSVRVGCWLSFVKMQLKSDFFLKFRPALLLSHSNLLPQPSISFRSHCRVSLQSKVQVSCLKFFTFARQSYV